MKQYTQTTKYINPYGKLVTITITFRYEEGKAQSVATPHVKVVVS